ncbi:MAG TPA: hypothetical protein VGM88_12555 [Kofleriaceae bacterium]
MKRLVLAAALAGCHPLPDGWSAPAADRWTIPLVGPLEDSVLIAPVYVHGHGPYLFRISPDSPQSMIDERVVKDAAVPPASHPDLRIGDLVVRATTPRWVANGALDVDGRRVDGVIGADILVDTVVLGFDRDAGLAYLVRRDRFVAPAGATAIGVREVDSEDEGWVPRRIVHARIGRTDARLHVDLGTAIGTLREATWALVHPEVRPADLHLSDPIGEPWHVTELGIVRDLSIAGLHAPPLAFAEDSDPPPAGAATDGTLGLDFFRPYRVWVDALQGAVYVAPRSTVAAAARIARWDSLRCAKLGCIDVELAPSADGAHAQLAVTRDPAMTGPLEVLLAPPAAEAHSIDPVVVNLPAGTARVELSLGPRYLGAHLQVVDASPFPRHCESGGCASVLPRREAL